MTETQVDITPYVFMVVAFIVGVVIASLPAVRARINLFGPASEPENTPPDKAPSRAARQPEPVSQPLSDPLSNPHEAVPLRSDRGEPRVIREIWQKAKNAARAAQSAPTKTATGDAAPSMPDAGPDEDRIQPASRRRAKPAASAKHPGEIPVEGLARGVFNALGDGLGSIVKTGTSTGKPIAQAIVQGSQYMAQGTKTKVDAFIDELEEMTLGNGPRR